MLALDKETAPSVVKKQTVIAAATSACARIAPVWPLDQFIAVNPWWSLTGSRPERVGADLAALSGARLVMPRAYFRKQWDAGRIGEQHLLAAASEAGVSVPAAKLVAHLEGEGPVSRMVLMTHLLDMHRDVGHHMAWQDEVTHEISQFCAAYFDQGQAAWHLDTSKALYPAWLQTVAHERGIGLVMGVKGLNRRFIELPADPHALIVAAVEELGIDENILPEYLHALLLSINGWSSWCAYRKWQAGLEGSDDDTLVQLLAIRLAWELVLYRCGEVENVAAEWALVKSKWRDLAEMNMDERSYDWVWQRAMELAYQSELAAKLAASAAPPPSVRPDVQAAFCIDVRSEVFRRSLESVTDQVQTLGFAGFFGMPIAYQPLGTEVKRPQLPGLLAPKMLVTDTCCQGDASDIAASRKLNLAASDVWRQMRGAGTSGFSYVEVAGLFYGWKLIKDGLVQKPESTKTPGVGAAEAARLKPRLVSDIAGTNAPELAAKVALASGVLKAMTLANGLAPLVLLVGHGSQTTNNPHAAGLDCGACCGQTGEVNARALAALLNDPKVREGLAASGIDVPSSTHFLPALHNTTTDEIVLFDLDEVPASHAYRILETKAWLEAAGARARTERAKLLGESGVADSATLKRAIKARSSDWAQVRPEWGLANNAAFIVGPRSLTRGIDLGGRTFLHDYDWRSDEGFKILELIMTAPMVVTHWINMQYYASTVDNVRYGSGNKVLHNVVGGNLGVFEGNGGDLRIGLPLQSLHDGADWVHQPLRISVIIDAPAEAMAGIVAQHAKVRELVDNEWLYLFRIDREERGLHRYHRGSWSRFG